MKLLCILADHQEQVVKREQLVSEIWNDYGGGEVGLTHAVSMLRKLLDDTTKTLIETIPTKGYILHAEIEDLQLSTGSPLAEPKRLSKRVFLYSGVALLALISLFFLFGQLTGRRAEVGPLTKITLSTPYDKVNQKTEETLENTIISIGSDSTEYKLKVMGDSRPQFYINGKLVSPDEMENHLELINNLKKQLEQRRSN
ncbi:MAG: hypothetical protein JWP88_2345 [Flaviaesturariibacter sp.]|nr:hypothetical protein [Flaviaesturariibacter sp.]